jgi:8-oxo-dGTP diphosphatase
LRLPCILIKDKPLLLSEADSFEIRINMLTWVELLERWLSGRKRHTANVLYPQGYPGFESLPLRHEERRYLGTSFLHAVWLEGFEYNLEKVHAGGMNYKRIPASHKLYTAPMLATITEAMATPEMTSKKVKDPFIRHTVRAIILDENHCIAVIHIKNFTYYTLPGGGIEDGESPEETVVRECAEEAGCTVEVAAYLGEIAEQQDHLKRIQISHCYTAYKKAALPALALTQEEVAKGYTCLWVPIEKALELIENCEPLEYKGHFVKVRDSLFLKEFLTQKNPSA